jgi:damage-control phosphatase, subfamily I
MISPKECKECCIDQIKRLAILLGTDEEHVLKAFEDAFANEELKSAPEYAELIFSEFYKLTGVDDPYKNVKESSNLEAQRLLTNIETELSQRLSGLKKLIELAIVGNVIDYGAFKEINIAQFISEALTAPYFKLDIEEFEKDINASKTILYIADNAGEIIFDKVLLEYLHSLGKKITVAVRGGPIINDVTFADAEFAELHKFAEIISTGSRIPGILLKRCSKEFVQKYTQADLVIAKGQGNFETLHCIEKQKPKKLYYLFVIKCPTIARLLGGQVKDKVLMKSVY